MLGLHEITKPAALRGRGGVWFAMDEGQLHIGVDPDFRPATKAHPALLVSPDQLSVLAVRLTAAGYPVEEDDAIEGVTRFFTADPWGNRLEILAVQPRTTSRRSIVGASRGATAINRARRAPRSRRV